MGIFVLLSVILHKGSFVVQMFILSFPLPVNLCLFPTQDCVHVCVRMHVRACLCNELISECFVCYKLVKETHLIGWKVPVKVQCVHSPL